MSGKGLSKKLILVGIWQDKISKHSIVLHLYLIRALTNNGLGLLKPGMFVRVSVPLGSRESIMIPTEAIVPVLKGKVVYLMRAGRAEEVAVRTGVRTDRTIQVLEGIEVGDSVIVSALMSMKPDLPVMLQEVVSIQTAP